MIFDILVNTGFRYDYYATVEAVSAFHARKIWKLRGDWVSEDFKVRKVKDTQ